MIHVSSGIKLICLGYVYGKQCVYKNKTHWRCTKRLAKDVECKARAITSVDCPGYAKLTNKPHNHGPNLETFMKKNIPSQTRSDFRPENVSSLLDCIKLEQIDPPDIMEYNQSFL